MAVAVKICGLSTPEALDVAIEAGADMLGFVFFPPSPRHLSYEVARSLADDGVACSDDAQWDRLVFLFGALEALCFAGAGALFGTSVQRGNVIQARQDASEAKATAEAAREEASARGLEAEAERGNARVQAERGMNLAETIRAVAAAGADQGQAERQGARPEEFGAAAAPAALEPVVELANRLFPKR